MRVVVDTNVWVSGLIAPSGAPGRILEAVLHGRLEALASWELAQEIVEVLARPRLRRYGITDDDVHDVLVLLAPMLPEVDVDLPLRDPHDAPVVAAAEAARADAIMTGDRDLLEDEDLRAWLARRGIDLYSPAEPLERIGAA